MANSDNYITLLVYLLVFNLVASFVFATITTAVGGTSQPIAEYNYTESPGGIYTPVNYTDSTAFVEIGTSGFWANFIGSLIFVPTGLWDEVFPIGMIVVTLFLLVKMGIVFCAWKVLSPTSG
jgi:hypothetical protein